MLVERLFDPFLLIRVSTSSNDVLLATRYICLDVGALRGIVSKVFPFLEVIKLNLLALTAHHYTHVMLAELVAAAAGHAWLGEIHYVECVFFALLAALGSEMEPLLMSTRICIHLHEQVVSVWCRCILLCLQQVSRLK